MWCHVVRELSSPWQLGLSRLALLRLHVGRRERRRGGGGGAASGPGQVDGGDLRGHRAHQQPRGRGGLVCKVEMTRSTSVLGGGGGGGGANKLLLAGETGIPAYLRLLPAGRGASTRWPPAGPPAAVGPAGSAGRLAACRRRPRPPQEEESLVGRTRG